MVRLAIYLVLAACLAGLSTAYRSASSPAAGAEEDPRMSFEATAPLPPKPPGGFRLVTYNIRHGTDEDDRPTLDEIGAWIRAADPDLVFLSEVDENWRRSGFVDQAAYLSEATGLPHRYYAPALVSRSLHRTAFGRTARYGSAFLSKHPLIAAKEIPLPRLGRNEPRNVLYVEIHLEGVAEAGGVLRVFGTHLSVRPEERKEQLAAIGRLMEAEAGPVVLLGDLNSPPYRLTREAPYLDSDRWWDTAVGARAAPTFPAESPRERIDYILVDRTLRDRVRAAFVPDVRASDHRPVIADLSFAGP